MLRTKVAGWSDEQLWHAYIQLTQAEAAFRIQKDELQVRPIWHQRADRVQAHILVCFLAFVLWKCLEMWHQCAGLRRQGRNSARGVDLAHDGIRDLGTDKRFSDSILARFDIA